MNTLPLSDQRFQPVDRFPVEERAALMALAGAFPEALDLVFTNPPLAVALANADCWDTFGLVRVDRAFVCDLLRKRRRGICGVLGYPSSERVVRILGKVQPQACRASLLARFRCSLRNPALLSILSHLPTIEAAELRLAADWGCRPRISFALFTDMAAQLPCETEGGWGRLLRQTETLLRLGAREYRLLRSVQQTRRHYYRRWRELADLENFDPTHEDAVAADILFPPVPIPGIEEIQPIDSAAALVAEARAMGHCVLSYAEQVAEGDAYLYRVMNPQRATLLVGFCGAGWHLKELAGVRNQPVSRETENLVESWLRSARHQQSRQFV